MDYYNNCFDEDSFSSGSLIPPPPFNIYSDSIYSSSENLYKSLYMSPFIEYPQDYKWYNINGKVFEREEEVLPKMTVHESKDQMSLGHRYAVSCSNYSDLSPNRILKTMSIMKSKLMMQCLPYKSIDKITCKMSLTVKNNIINAYRKLSMYGKKTPFVARFDEYGRRLSDEIKIDTIHGMNIEIINSSEYGENYLVFEVLIPYYSTKVQDDKEDKPPF